MLTKKISWRSVTLVVVVAAIAVVSSVGCDLFGGVSTDERVSNFMSDLAAGNWSSMRSHIHPSVEGRGSMNSAYFSAAFGEPYRETSRSGSGSNRSVSVARVSNSSITGTVTIRTRESGGDAYIDYLRFNTVDVVPFNDDI